MDCRTDPVVLLPPPRHIQRSAGEWMLPSEGAIYLVGPQPERLHNSGLTVQKALSIATKLHWPIGAAWAGSAAADGLVTLEIDNTVEHAQGYRLVVDEAGVRITGSTPEGIFYGAQTFAQLLRQYGRRLPQLEITDWPDFPTRGMMIDISRDKVPTMASLYALVDQLAEWKLNQVQLYTEHTFAYREHREAWAQASPMTGEEILSLDAYCRERFIELVPNQNSFGHFERWLRLPRYKHLAEAPDGSKLPWGSWWDGPASLCPLDDGSLELVRGLYDELLPHFSSRMFNVGCDETWDIGQGRSREAAEAHGKERVYLDFLLKIHKEVSKRGRTMQFWGDIILHKPELIRELPRDIIALQWGYFATHPYERDGQYFKDAGIPFYVCPGTSSWQAFLSRTDNALANLKNAAVNGLKHGAIGYLNTDWGDLGHHQFWSGSFVPLAAGAGFGWCVEATNKMDLLRAIDTHVFRDRAGVMAKLAFDLGNIYQRCGRVLHAASPLFRVLVPVPSEPINPTQGITREQFDDAQAAIAEIIGRIDSVEMDDPDAQLIADEFRTAAALMTHACRLGRWHHDSASESLIDLAGDLRKILGEYRRLWLARNRIGGLTDSAGRLETVLRFYHQQIDSNGG